MSIRTRDKTVYLHDDDPTRISVQNPTHVDLDNASISDAKLKLYVEMKLHRVAPWLVNSRTYQNAFEEAFQLCQSGYDFNLIVYEQPVGSYITCYEPMIPICQTDNNKRVRKKKGWRRYWRRLFRSSRHQVRPKYRGEIVMVPGKSKWVEEKAGRFIVVPEGILRCNAWT